jgi:hypothetical protein
MIDVQVESDVAEDNQASRRVAEKAGFHLAGTFTDHDGTSMIRYQARFPRLSAGMPSILRKHIVDSSWQTPADDSSRPTQSPEGTA